MSGTAAYLNDEIETDEYVRMTFSYNMKTTQVTAVSDENTIHTAACTADATHVITEVKYGFNAFMIFEVQETTSESKEMIAGELEIMIKTMPSVEISGSGSINLTDTQ